MGTTLLKKDAKNKPIKNRIMPIPLATGIGLGMQAAGGAAKAFGIGQGYNRQIKQQQKLNEQQLKGNKEMADYNHNLQMDLWNKTNYEAQVKKMKEAGINPALMYGGTGSGGTTQAIGGQGISGGSAQMSGGLEMQGMGMLPAQIELIKAQTENVKADTATKGVQPANVEAETILKGAQKGESEERTRGIKIDNDWREFLRKTNEYGESIASRNAILVNEKLIGEIRKIDKELQAIGVNIIKGRSEIDRINADTNLKKQTFEQLQKLNPMEIESITKELEMLRNNPRNTEEGQWATAILGWLGELAGLGLKGAMTNQILGKPTSGEKKTTIINWGEQ
jgi:hypothetical protein